MSHCIWLPRASSSKVDRFRNELGDLKEERKEELHLMEQLCSNCNCPFS